MSAITRSSSDLQLPSGTAGDLRRGKFNAERLKQLFAAMGLEVLPQAPSQRLLFFLSSSHPRSRQDFEQQIDPMIAKMDQAACDHCASLSRRLIVSVPSHSLSWPYLPQAMKELVDPERLAEAGDEQGALRRSDKEPWYRKGMAQWRSELDESPPANGLPESMQVALFLISGRFVLF